MKNSYLSLCSAMLLSCRTTTYYMVRHAEKEMATTMTADVPLSEKGTQQALALKDVLLHKNIQHIFSTAYARTKATAQPLSNASGIPIEVYNPADRTFITQLRKLAHGNVLIVGHSNTVGDLVNGITGKNLLQDLSDAQYGNLFIVSKRGKRYSYSRASFGL